MTTTKINWLTADKKKSIKSSSKPVYLIQPDGREPIGEANYMEDAFFGGYDLFSWLSIMNLDVNLSELGRALSNGEMLNLSSNKNIFLYCETQYGNDTIRALKEHLPKDAEIYGYDHDDYIELDGVTKRVSQFLKNDVLIPVPMNKYLPYDYPLKFSHNPKAIYEKLPASERRD